MPSGSLHPGNQLKETMPLLGKCQATRTPFRRRYRLARVRTSVRWPPSPWRPRKIVSSQAFVPATKSPFPRRMASIFSEHVCTPSMPVSSVWRQKTGQVSFCLHSREKNTCSFFLPLPLGRIAQLAKLVSSRTNFLMTTSSPRFCASARAIRQFTRNLDIRPIRRPGLIQQIKRTRP